jgi:anti-sigma regulatory factor (Ser/Thr protein kinase)
MVSMTAPRTQIMPPVPEQLEPALARWPLHAALELGALSTAPGCARAWTRQIAWEWRLSRLASNAELIVSELVTNAVQASRAMRQAAVRIWLVSDRGQIVVFVWDASPLPPVLADPGEDAENGRGLLLVEAVSERWGHFGSDRGGKVVWAVIPGTGPSPDRPRPQ